MIIKTEELIVFIFVLGVRVIAVQAELNTDDVVCGPTETVCECKAEATACQFKFYIELVPTFTRFNSSLTQGQGERVYIDTQAGKINSLRTRTPEMF